MTAVPIDFEALFDADACRREGSYPWTFFAYPTALADERGLPPDEKACQLLAMLQQHGIQVAVWINGIATDTTYFACRKEDMQFLNDVLEKLEREGYLERNFCVEHSEQLFRRLASI